MCGSFGKKLAKDAQEGGTEKLSRHGVVPKAGPSNGSLCRAALAFSVPELGPKFGASSVFAKERGLVFVTHFGRIFRTQKHACDSDIVCARHRQSDTAVGIGTWTRNRKTGCAMQTVAGVPGTGGGMLYYGGPVQTGRIWLDLETFFSRPPGGL